MKIRFYKEINNRWYADVPTWEGDRSDLEMVCGADEMLNILAQGESDVFTELSYDTYELKSIHPKVILTKWDEVGVYKVRFYPINMSLDMIWLCEVTVFVFGYYPEIIKIY